MHPALDIPGDIITLLVSLGIPDRSLVAMGTAAYILLSSFTALVTALIAARLLLVRRRLTKAMGKCLMFSSMLYVVAES